MTISFLIAAVLGCLGLLFAWLGLRRLGQGRPFALIRNEFIAVSLLLAAMLMLLLGSNLVIYNRLVYETPVASISFRETGPLQFEASLREVNQLERSFMLNGDEWQLDARVLKWHGVANLTGLDAQYRLHRLAGRYTNIDQERVASRSIYEVSSAPEVDIWKLASDYGRWLSWLVDAAYGSAVYLPMTDAAEYEITVSQSGLVARPVNEEARRAVGRWIGL